MENSISFGDNKYTVDQFNSIIRADINNTADNGLCKVASEAGSSYIRMQVFEDGFTRRILPAEPIDYSELSTFFHDVPGKIGEVEPTQSVAASVPFDHAMDTLYYMAPKYLTTFYDIKTPKFQKNVKNLNTYKMDLRKVIMDNALKSITKQEDWDFVELTESALSVGGATVTFSGGLNRSSIVEMAKIMGRQNLPQGTVLTNFSTFMDFIKLGRNAWGGDGAEKMLREGAEGMGEPVMCGMKFISTYKSDIVNDNVSYIYTQPDYLGKFYELEQPVVYVEKRQDRITCEAMETLGMSIVNTRGVAKVILFNGTESSNTPYPIPEQGKVNPTITLPSGG